MKLAIQIIVGTVVAILGFAVYTYASYKTQMSKKFSWGNSLTYGIIAVIGYAILLVAEWLIGWFSLPNLFRWTCIASMLVLGIGGWIFLQIMAKAKAFDDTRDRILVFALYGGSLGLLLLGFRLLLLESGH